MLLIESGSRALLEETIPKLRATWGPELPVTLITCYGGLPAGLPQDTEVFRVTDFGSPEKRRILMQQLRRGGYTLAGMICSGEPIMTKWKWLIAWKVPAKFLIVNENGDYFWAHRENSAIIREFVLVRLGLTGAGAIRTIGRILLFPFSVLFLLLYAGVAHAGRLWRIALHPAKYNYKSR